MQLYPTEPSQIQSRLPFVPNYGAPSPEPKSLGSDYPSELKEQSAEFDAISPRLIRSVVETAGLGRFVYLEGFSGKRYVFSHIRSEQVSLYENALFATTLPTGECVRVGADFDELRKSGSVVYVHLLDADKDSVLADLSCQAG